MIKEIGRRSLEEIPFDHSFSVNGQEELCHATGDEVLFSDSETWWNEYIDSTGEFHYGN